ncbi:VOC family protein [Niveibacterium sp. SC-1]|uniref:VOC family protein n=1 Tax=Niveibacterium sp. SC-1 TaxID=3135646 RepID=UPI00311EF46E
MLGSEKLVGFVATATPGKSRVFYEDTLGLQLLEDSPFALVFRAGATTIRVQKVQGVVVSGYTALGWQVSDIARTVEELAARGVAFQRYEGMDQDATGIWRTPDGSRVAWFRDPDGNTLSITQMVAA